MLQLLFPGKYEGAVLSDAPDIVAKESDIGVEVTNSLKETVQRKGSAASRLSGKRLDELTDGDRERINAGLISVYCLPTGVILASFSHWGDCHDLVAAYRKKTEKLNKPHFTVFGENNLLIAAWTIDSDELEPAVSYLVDNWAESHGQKYHYFFDCVYILAEGFLIELNLRKAIVKSHGIRKEEMNAISNSAFKDVLGVSRDEFYGR